MYTLLRYLYSYTHPPQPPISHQPTAEGTSCNAGEPIAHLLVSEDGVKKTVACAKFLT